MADQLSATAGDDLDSDEDDDDYMPSEEESEEEVVSGIEDDVLDSGEAPKKGKKRKGRSDKASSRKRRGGFELEDENKNDDQPNESIALKTECPKDEESQKKRAESLWADFLSDVPPPAKQNATAKPLSKPAGHEIKKVTVTKVYQFAGEDVKVVKEVDANSKELFLDTSISKKEPKKENNTEDAKTPPAAGVIPRQSGLSSVLGKISGNKNKLSTLEKSKLDWETFKSENRISEDLEQHNRGKDGYLEKQAFLERADLRQFENEKTLRIKGRNTKNC